MTPDELLDMLNKAATNELNLGERMLDEHQDQADRILARNASAAIVEMARAFAANPTGAAA